MNNDNLREKITNNVYYIVVLILSILSLTFLPLLGSSVGMSLNIPTTLAGWIVYVATKLIICCLNMLIFHSFIKQAKLNIKDDKNFKEAEQILEINKEKGYIPRSPKKFLSHQYGKKGTTVFITSLLSVFALGQALLSFDFASFLSYLLTIIVGCIFGFLTMKNNELYWTTEFLDYAKKIQKECEELEKEKELKKGEIFKLDFNESIENCKYIGNIKENK